MKHFDHRPWRDAEFWPRHGPWQSNLRGKQRSIFRMFFLFFLLIVVFSFIGMGTIFWLLYQWIGGNSPTLLTIWLVGPALVLIFLLLLASVVGWFFRQFGSPLAALMAAADAVAEGDFSVRVPVRGPRDFARLSASFNRMVQELQRSDQQRRNLTADVAHELRTPLHIIQGNLEGILDGVYQPSEDHIEATLEETRHLARLVDDLQTLSLAESGQISLKYETVNVAELLADELTSFSPRAETAQINLNLDVQGDPAGLIITADSGRLDQVLGNLINNAFRHTPAAGSITLAAEPVSGGVRLHVTDTGEGISPEDLPFIFDRFWRGDRSRGHVDGGTSGLGLAISKQLVQAHGGRIQVESDPGKRTTFTIDLPTDPTRQPEPGIPQEKSD
jgi:two-component system OmpR family sensor kinase/two-component system sensor histidine kinase BaeS